MRLARSLGNTMAELTRNKSGLAGLIIVTAFLVMAVFAPFISPADPDKGDIADRLIPPAWSPEGSSTYILGTDSVGRDILSHIIYGSRVSMAVGIISVTISAGVGGVLGAVAGYCGGWPDKTLSRFGELLMAFPFLIFAIGIMAVMGPGFANLIGALTFKSWVEFFRLVRGETLDQKGRDYVSAARALGLSGPRIMASEITPNVFQSVLVLSTLRLGDMIMVEASLSFLGIGVQPGIPAWGSMIASGRDLITRAWWVSTMPGVALLLLVLGLNLLGEGLRDITDPRLRTS
ncbi:MAG: ABC transporter permease [Ignavibacteriales bacterium]